MMAGVSILIASPLRSYTGADEVEARQAGRRRAEGGRFHGRNSGWGDWRDAVIWRPIRSVV